MRPLLIVVLAVAIGGAAPAAPLGHSTARGPFLLVGLPSLGTVSWRCDGRGHYALGFRVLAHSATTGLRFRAGTVAKTAIAQPGEPIRFPYVHAHRQRLTVVQGNEVRTLRASVVVYFAPHYTYCWSYLVPRINVAIRPHFNY